MVRQLDGGYGYGLMIALKIGYIKSDSGME